jgi:alpha-tubulin suppressor-like RCC1 family protein
MSHAEKNKKRHKKKQNRKAKRLCLRQPAHKFSEEELQVLMEDRDLKYRASVVDFIFETNPSLPESIQIQHLHDIMRIKLNVPNTSVWTFGINTHKQLGRGYDAVAVDEPGEVTFLRNKSIKSLVCGDSTLFIITRKK